MSWSSKDILYLVELIIYLGILPCTIFSAYKHGRRSILGHFYLVGFCGIRIVADALLVSGRNGTPSTTAFIVNSVGLSPLLLAILGFIGEAHAYVNQSQKTSKNKSLSFLVAVVLHCIIVTGIALLAVGLVNAYSSDSTPAKQISGKTLAIVGAFTLLLGWTLITLRGVLVFREAKQEAARGNTQPRLLATEILVSLPFAGLRTIYTVIEVFDFKESPALAGFATIFFLLFLSQLICVVILLVALFLTRNMKHQSESQRSALINEQEYRSKPHEMNGHGPSTKNNRHNKH